MSKGRGILFIISGPSGVGKGTVLKRVCENAGDISVSVSVTTRKPREGEIDGIHYSFITQDAFKNLVKTDGMYEYVEALDCGYGTPKKAVNEKLKDRAIRIVAQIADVSHSEALSTLLKCDWEIKTAIVSLMMDVNIDIAREELKKHGGVLRKILFQVV